MSQPVVTVQSISKLYDIRPSVGAVTAVGNFIGRLMRGRLGEPAAPPDPAHSLWALKDISFEVNDGDVFGIIGQNGAGKSTLLKVLSRITQPTQGRAVITGRLASLLEVGTGFNPELTGRENVYLNGAILGMSRREIEKKFDEIVEFSGVEQFIDTPVKRYSSGMYVRLGFAVAAHLEPDILVVDEVLAVGDYAFQNKCMAKMENTANSGRTVIFVSHNIAAVQRMCPKSILLEKGQLVKAGRSDDVIEEYLNRSAPVITGAKDQSEWLQATEPSKAMSLRRVALTDENGQVMRPFFRWDQTFHVTVEYEINEPVRDCLVWVGVESQDGVMLFCTSDYDTDHTLLGPRSPGFYRARVEIPSRWLNYGKYKLIAGAVQNAPFEIFDRVEMFTFNILEIGCPSSLYGPGSRRGLLQPVISWTVEKDPLLSAKEDRYATG